MSEKAGGSIHGIFWGAIVSIIFLLGPVPAYSDPIDWLRIYANYQETIEYLEGGSRPAGYLTGSSITPLQDGDLLVTGFVKPVQGNNRRLAVLKAGPGGGVSWYRELGPLTPDRAAPIPQKHNEFLTWAEAAALPDGGAAVVFGSQLMKLNADGEPEWTRRFIRPYQTGDKVRAFDLRLKAVVLREPEGFFLLGVEPQNPLHPEWGGHLVLIATDTQGQNPRASLLEGLKEGSRPKLLRTESGLAVGADPKAVALFSPEGSFIRARALESLPFLRGPERRPDRGDLMSFRGLAVMAGGDLSFGGLYDLSYTTYDAPGALVCRLSPDAASVRWTTRVHSRIHGGWTEILDLAAQGDDIYLVGNSSEFGASEPRVNNTAVAMKMDGAGNLVWISSLGRKRRSEARSEYTDDWGLAAVPAGDGGLFMAGTTNSFSHPVPFHRIKQWATEHCDLLLARFGPDGGLSNVPQGRYPAIFNQTDPGDKKMVDVVHPPIEIRDLPVTVSPVEVRALTVNFESTAAQWETRFSDDPRTGNKPPVADFTVAPGKALLTAALDGSSSSDPDDDPILDYQWRFGTNGFDNGRTGTGRTVVYRGGAAPDHSATLTVKDQFGLESAPVTKNFWIFQPTNNEAPPAAEVCRGGAAYEIEVSTGDMKDAGTDAKVFLSLWSPADEKGRRCTSGDFRLDTGSSPGFRKGMNLFERSGVDHFNFPDLGQYRALSQVDYAILRNDNSGHKPGWFVEGFKVRDATNDKDWYFVPLAWLSKTEPAARPGWGQFQPCEPYPCGVLLGRNPGLAWRLTAASNHVIILPKNAESVFLTACERDQELEVYLGDESKGRQDKNGSGPRRPPYIGENERGVEVRADQITGPTRYDFKLRSDGGWQSGAVWLFPHQWTGYQATARQVTLLMPLEGRTEELFDVWNKAEARLKGTTIDLTAAFQGVVDYGRDAIGIFGDIPDNTLQGMTQGAAEEYLNNQLVVALASKSVELSADALSEMRTVFTTLTQAYDWGNRLDGVVTDLQGQVFEKVVLEEIPEHVTDLSTIKDLLAVLKTETENLISQVQANEPYQCREIMSRIKTLVAGDLAGMTQAQLQAGAGDPEAFKIDYRELGVASGPARGYPLAYLFLAHYHTARGKWGNPDEPEEWFWHDTSAQNDLCDELAKYGICTNDVRKSANVSAMKKYVPLLEGLGSLISILLNACLVP